jgi:hypothetical protein
MPSDGIIKDREYLPCEGIVQDNLCIECHFPCKNYQETARQCYNYLFSFIIMIVRAIILVVGITARIGINRYKKISYSPSTKTY